MMSGMSLEHAILVSLAERSASGYDLARRFDKSIGHFWSASHQQIYKILARMEQRTLVSAEAVTQDGRPDKRVYEITAAGRGELREWSSLPAPVEKLRSDLAVKIRGMRFGDRDAVIADIGRHRDEHQRQLNFYLDNTATHFGDEISADELGAWLVLRGGIRYEEGQIAWADEMLDALQAVDRGQSVSAGAEPVRQSATLPARSGSPS